MFVIVEQTKLVVEDLGTISQMEGRIRKTLDLRPPVTNGDDSDPDEWHTHHVTHVLEGPFKAVLEGTTRSHHDDVPVQIAARYHDDVSCPKHNMLIIIRPRRTNVRENLPKKKVCGLTVEFSDRPLDGLWLKHPFQAGRRRANGQCPFK